MEPHFWCSLAFMSIHEHSHVAISTQEHGTIVPKSIMRANEHSWAWHHGTITTHSALAQYFSVLMSAHKCSWVLLSAPEYPCAILKVQGVDSVINIKCWFLKWLPFSILAISRSRFQQIIPNWIVLKSTWKGLLKIVQDGISTPLGSREIQKTKVYTVLWDTLYIAPRVPYGPQIWN